jgi:hypothetical protein
MITVRDHEREPVSDVPANEENRRKGLCFLNSLQVFVDVRIVTRQKRELSGAQQILRGMFKELRATKAFDERTGFPVGAQKQKEFERSVEISAFLRFAPLQFWLAHGLPAPLFRASPGDAV